MNAGLQPRERALREIVGDLAVVPESLTITDLSLDSTQVRPGAAFLACRGRRTHGLEFASAAVAAGARAILYEPEAGRSVPHFGSDICVVPVPALARQASRLADRFFDAPSSALVVTGITGTNGKTTTCWILAEALRALGRRPAYLGTLGAGFPPALRAATLTTPDAVSVQRELAALRAAGADCVVMEVSSHALDQDRVTAVRFRCAAFTNLSRDHLDYHGSMEAYAQAKARLFAFESLERCVLNADDARAPEFARRVAGDVPLVLTTCRRPASVAPEFGREAARGDSIAWVRGTVLRRHARGVEIRIESAFGEGLLELPLVGDFNVENGLTALAVLLASGVPLEAATVALGRTSAPPGRMEAFGGGEAPLVIVDFAHTPDALTQALAAARGHGRGRLWVVFGCGGDRDRGKRPLMGRAAAAAADELVLTDDNPRSEDPAEILADIVRGLPPATRYQVIPERAAAIRTALAAAAPDDVVLVAGKGHEDSQIHGAVRRPFSDRDTVRAALGERRA